MKKMDKKAFTLIELIVVIAVVGILVLLGVPRFIGHTQKAELTRIQYDIKVMEQEIGTVLINNDDDIDKWENNNKDFNQLIQEGKLFEKEGIAKEVEPKDETYKVIPEKYKDKINTKLKGTFYANSGGKVYYEHTKPLVGIPTQPTEPSEPEEEESEYSDEEIQDLIRSEYVPVATAEELNSIRNNTERIYGEGTKWEGLYTSGLDKHYVQVDNIDLSEYSEDGWDPIGTNSSIFTGTYDGGNYVIRGLDVKGGGKNNQGLFGFTEGATISNVGLIDNKVTGSNNVGGLVGMAQVNTMIENSYTTGSVVGSSWSIGGLVGWAQSGTTISNSYTTGSVTGSSKGNVGGLVGEFGDNTEISNSYTTGSVTGVSNIGGLVGYAGSYDDESRPKISNSYSTGSVKGTDNSIGGLVGYIMNSTIENSYSTGSVEGTKEAGGLVGQAYASTMISNSYATGPVTGTENIGGLMGKAENSTISNSYWDTETTLQEESAGGVGMTTDEMKKQTTYSGWNFVDVWKIDEGNDYPELR